VPRHLAASASPPPLFRFSISFYNEVKSYRPVNFTDSTAQPLPPRGSGDSLRVAEGGALPYEGARHCPGFSVRQDWIMSAASPSRFCFAATFVAVSGFIQEQILSRNVERFRGGLVFKAHTLLNHSILGSRVIKKRRKSAASPSRFCFAATFVSVFGLIHGSGIV
jgi:hypothetical protein